MTALSRRRFLRGSGVTLALPLFHSLAPGRAFSQEAGSQFEPDGVPRRMICICNNLGLHRPFYVPEGTGRGYKPSRYLQLIDEFRDDYTVFLGVSLPAVDGGHIAEKSFLTGAPHSTSPPEQSPAKPRTLAGSAAACRRNCRRRTLR